MDAKKYLESVLREQTLAADGQELTSLRAERRKVEELLKREFEECTPKIRYGGSMAKGTMNRSAYDLDLPCYFGREDTAAGESLKEIYNNVKSALAKDYITDPKTSAIRLRAKEGRLDFHIDVVPGRFVDGDDGDVFIHQDSAEKKYLRTNLDTHIAHIRDSGVLDAIRLIKYWRDRNGLGIKTFVLELLVVELLKSKKTASLDKQVTHVWTEFRDSAADLKVEDPANPTGNALSGYLDSVRSLLSISAGGALASVESGNWAAIFGEVEQEDEKERIASLGRIAASVPVREKPWCCES